MNKKLLLSALVACTAAPCLVVAAEGEEGDDFGVTEIVITAQKRTERLSDVPVAVSVLSADTVAKLNAGDVSDLNRLVPSVNLNGTINGRVPLGIRGISSVSNEGTVGLSSGVAFMVDGVPVPSDSRAANSLEDVQSIEVLKGPQATLGGRTAATGVINVVTRQPTDELTGSLSAMATDDGEYRLNGFISGPISDTVGYSLSLYGTDRDYPIRNLRLNEVTSQQVYGVRGKLKFSPNENLDVKLTARVGRDNSSGFNFVYTHLSSGVCLLIGGCPPPGSPGYQYFPFPFLDQSVLLPGISANFDNQSYSSPNSVYSTVKDTDFNVDVSYQIGELTFGSTTAYQHEELVNVQDLFAVNEYFFNLFSAALVNIGAVPPPGLPPFGNTQTQWIDAKQFSQEFKLVSPADRDFSYVLGLFYSDTKIRLQQDRGLLPAFVNIDVEPVTKTTGLYGRVTKKLGESNALVAGLRFNRDELSYRYLQNLYTASFPPPVIYVGLSASGSTSESTVVGDLAFKHNFHANSMVYASYARGYGPAAYNTAQALTPTVLPAVPEIDLVNRMDIDHLELGAKSSFLDNRLTVNAALFDTVYKDFQVQIFDQSSASINPPLILANAGEAETRGLEVDLNFAATANLRLGLNVALVDAQFNDYSAAPCHYPDAPGLVPAGCYVGTNGTVVQDLDGKTMPNSPKFKAVLNLEQRWPMSDGKHDLILGGNYSHRSEAQMLVDQNPYAIQESFGILNLSLGVESLDGRYSLTLFANNVGDQHYFTDLEDFWSAPWGATNTVIGQPARDTNRYLGLRFNTKL